MSPSNESTILNNNNNNGQPVKTYHSTDDSTASAPVDNDVSEELLSTWELILLCIPVVPSQLGWALGESVLVPYLISLGVEEELANVIWLVNPIVAFIVAPGIGSISDSCTSKWGRRRPFLLIFHIAVLIGLALIAFGEDVLSIITTAEPIDSDGKATIPLLIIVFTGCVLMELGNDLLTIPSRALLNDNLPEAQLEKGNAYFAAMNSLAAVIGLSFTIIPIHHIYPFTLLRTQLRACFLICIVLILISNFFTMLIPEYTDEEDDNVTNDIDTASNTNNTIQHNDDTSNHSNASLISTESDTMDNTYQNDDCSRIQKSSSQLSTDSEVYDDNEELDDGEIDTERMGFFQSILAFRLLPKELLAIWVTQFAWWLVIMQISFWWTTWVGKIVFGANPVYDRVSFDDGVRYGIIGSLVQSIVSFFSSQGLTYVNNTFGVTRVYHTAASLFSAACAALYFFRSKESTMIFMIFTGILYPVINANPFILIEVYTYDEDSEDTTNDNTNNTDNHNEFDKSSATQSSGTKSISPITYNNIISNDINNQSFTSLNNDQYNSINEQALYSDFMSSADETSASESETELNDRIINKHQNNMSNAYLYDYSARPIASDNDVSDTGFVSDSVDSQQQQPVPAGYVAFTALPLNIEHAQPAYIYDTDTTVSPPSNAMLPRSTSDFTDTMTPLPPPAMSSMASTFMFNTPRNIISDTSVPNTPTNIFGTGTDQSNIHGEISDYSELDESKQNIDDPPTTTTTNHNTDNSSVDSTIPRTSDVNELDDETVDDSEEYLSASQHRGVLTAIMNLSMGLSQILSATIGGAVIHFFDDISIVFLLSGLLSLAVNVIVVGFGYSTMIDGTTDAENIETDDELDVIELMKSQSTGDIQSAEQSIIDAEKLRKHEVKLKERHDRQKLLEYEIIQERIERNKLLRQMLGRHDHDTHSIELYNKKYDELVKKYGTTELSIIQHELKQYKLNKRKHMQPPAPLLVPIDIANSMRLKKPISNEWSDKIKRYQKKLYKYYTWKQQHTQYKHNINKTQYNHMNTGTAAPFASLAGFANANVSSTIHSHQHHHTQLSSSLPTDASYITTNSTLPAGSISIEGAVLIPMPYLPSRQYRRLHRHGDADYEITTRKGLTGRYSKGNEAAVERQRLQLDTIRRKEREQRHNDRMARKAKELNDRSNNTSSNTQSTSYQQNHNDQQPLLFDMV